MKELLARVRQAADALKDRFQVRRVVLFGSLANTSGWALKSDVDLAIEGLAPNAYWEAWRVVEEIIKDRPVDLIEMENAKSSLLQAIEKYGIEL